MPDKKLDKTDPLFSNALNLNPEKREFQFVPRLEVRQNSPEWLRLVIYALSLLVGCVSAIIVMSWAGVKPDDLIHDLNKAFNKLNEF